MVCTSRFAGTGVAALLVASAAVVTAQEPTRLFTLADAVAQALRQNPRLLEQHDGTERGSIGVEAARNAFAPKFVPNIRGSFGQTDVTDQNYRLDLSQRFVSGTELRAGVGTSTAQVPTIIEGQDLRYYNSDTTLMVSQPLLKGAGRATGRRTLTAAELRRDDASRQLVMAEQQVTVDVAASYYRVVAQESLVVAATQSFNRARQLRDASEAKLDAGLVSQLDVLRAQQLVAQAEIQLFDAQAAVEDARDQLRFLVGWDAGTAFVVTPDIPVRNETVVVEDAIAQAMKLRPDLRSAEANAADSNLAIEAAKNQLLPQVDVNFALTRRQTADSFLGSFGSEGFRFATFFNISMPVDRTPQLLDYRNALMDRDRRRLDLELIRRRITDDVRRNLRERNRLQRNMIVAETNVRLAQQEVDVARLRYERGLSNNLDVVTAETNLLTAESRRILTQADLAINWVTLRATTGSLDPRADADFQPVTRP
jgi:outer membrane protein TolC